MNAESYVECVEFGSENYRFYSQAINWVEIGFWPKLAQICHGKAQGEALGAFWGPGSMAKLSQSHLEPPLAPNDSPLSPRDS